VVTVSVCGVRQRVRVRLWESAGEVLWRVSRRLWECLWELWAELEVCVEAEGSSQVRVRVSRGCEESQGETVMHVYRG